MTISSTTRKAGPFIGTGLQTVFPFTFKVFAAADLLVVQAVTSTGVETPKVLTTDYTVVLNADQNASPGGNLTLLVALPTVSTLTLTSQVANTQNTDLTNAGGFYPRVINDALDRLTILTQQIAEGLSRAVKTKLSDTITPEALRDSLFAARDTSGISASAAAASAAAALETQTTINNIYRGALAVDPITRVGGSANVMGDEVFNTTAGLLKRWNGAAWQASDISTANLAASGGSALVGVIADGVGAVPTTVARKLKLWVDAVADFGVPNNGVSDATPFIKTMITAAAALGVSEIYFAPGTYLIKSPASELGAARSYGSGVIWKGLKNIRIRGSRGTKFIQDSTGAGPPEFGMFRIEECENIEFCYFEMDGSGIPINGTGAHRSNGFFICNHDLDTKVDYANANKGVHIHHLKASNFGGFVTSATKTSSLAYPIATVGVSVHDNIAANISGQNHFVGLTYTHNVHVYNNVAINPLISTAQIGNVFCDCSAGVFNALVENNHAEGFTGGGKAETHTLAGPGANEDRPSRNVVFRNNRFLQTGCPVTMIYPGGSGGGFYGIKLNGINCAATNNTITARTALVTTGGLYQGFQLTSSSVVSVPTLLTVRENTVTGTVIGINHDTPVADPNRDFTTVIRDNRLFDMVAPATPTASNDGTGILVSKNALVEGNKIYRSPYAAVIVQIPDQTIVRNNDTYNCATINYLGLAARLVFAQAGTGAQGYWEFSGNTISDNRGVSAADYGYFFSAGATYTNKYCLTPGLIVGLKTAISWDPYLSALGESRQQGGTLMAAPRTFVSTNKPDLIAPYNALAWQIGDRAIFATPAVGVAKAWVCTVSGTPGTWVSEGNL